MKTKIAITEIEHDDIVNLFQFVYCTDFLVVDYDTTPLQKRGYKSGCFEDCVAELLLMGEQILIGDCYAEDADGYYGSRWNKWEEDEGTMWYTVSLESLKKSLEDCLNNGEPHIRTFMYHLMFNPEELDYYECTALLQCVLFGKEIYG